MIITPNTVIQGDCFDWMKKMPDHSVDMILADLPYGTTASKWDKIIDMKTLWSEYRRIIKSNGAIVLFSSGQFTQKLIASQEDIYRYKWIWVKTRVGNFVNANNRPMTSYEEICVFSEGVTANGCVNKMPYYPQGVVEVNKQKVNGDSKFGTMAGKRKSHQKETVQKFTNYPKDVLFFDSVFDTQHPTQKPIALFEYLIKTYTNENSLVLDNTAGVLTTAVACENTNRNFIAIEKEEEYINKGIKRLKGQYRLIK